jgi:hypothetical protein
MKTFEKPVRVRIIPAGIQNLLYWIDRDNHSLGKCSYHDELEPIVHIDAAQSSHGDPAFYVRVVYACSQGVLSIPRDPPTDCNIIPGWDSNIDCWVDEYVPK